MAENKMKKKPGAIPSVIKAATEAVSKLGGSKTADKKPASSGKMGAAAAAYSDKLKSSDRSTANKARETADAKQEAAARAKKKTEAAPQKKTVDPVRARANRAREVADAKQEAAARAKRKAGK